MPCHYPAKAFSLASGGISFVERGDVTGDIRLPCGQCMGCRVDRARDWSLRIAHEAKLHDQSYFITYTYSPETLPNPPSLDYSVFQKYLKRQRKASGAFRFFACGEYGDLNRRPHYHAIMFGLKLPDLVRFGGGKKHPTFTSETVTKAWGLGQVLIGSVTPQSANYVARYNLKKITGDRAEAHYKWVDPDTGEEHQLTAEMLHMSTRPGIGAGWYDQFHADFHTHDYAISDGKKLPVPRYYDKLAKRAKVHDVSQIKADRVVKAMPNAWNNTPERLAVRATVLASRLSLSKRPV